MSKKRKAILFVIGIILMTFALWPSVIEAFFPANLILCVIGGALIGWYGIELLIKD